MSTLMTEEEALTIEEVAQRLRKSEYTVGKLFRTKVIPRAYKIGGEWRIDRSDLEKYIEEQKNKQK